MKRFRKILCCILCAAILAAGLSWRAYAEESGDGNTGSIATPKAAVLMEAETGQVLYSVNAQARLPMASITKVMSLLVLADMIDAGELQLTDAVKASSYVSSAEGSVIWLEAGEEMTAKMVILADGVNSLLTQKAGLTTKPAPAINEVAVGAKETIQLDPETIESRFLCNPGEGASWLFAGSLTNGAIGGAFIYTNEDTVSVGIVATMSEVIKQDIPVYQMLENFKNRPEIAPVIRGGKLVEYSGHVVPEGGLKMMPELVGNGVIVAGDAAMMCMNLGYTVRGMDLAIAAGQIAGKAAAQALDAGDTSKAGLQCYKTMLDDSFVMRDMKQYQNFPEFLEECPRMFNEYPEMIRDIMNPMFIVDGKPRPSMKKMAMGPVKKVGIMKNAKDAMKGIKAL